MANAYWCIDITNVHQTFVVNKIKNADLKSPSVNILLYMYWFCNQSNKLCFKAAIQHTKFSWIFTPIYSLKKLTHESQSQSADFS